MTIDNEITDNVSAPKQEEKPISGKKDNGSKKKTSGLNTVVRQVGFAFLFFLLGALIVGLVLYLPTNSDLKAAEAELDRLYPIESDYADLVVEHERIGEQRIVYKILANASQMHVALVKEDKNRITQYLGYIEDDLENLSIADFPEITGSLQEQLDKVADKRLSDDEGAIEALQLFQNDLLLLIDNLE